MDEIARLGFAIPSAPLKEAADQMQRMSGAARIAEQASNGLTGATRSTAGASQIAAAALDGQTASLTRLTAAANSNERAVFGVGNAARVASTRIAQLSFQINDVATMLASGASPFQVLATQGGQVVQIYQGQGGVRAALADVAGLLRATATRFWPIAIAAAAGGLAIRSMQKDIEAATGRAISFGDTFSAAIKIVASDIAEVLKPALEELGPIADRVWHLIVDGAHTAANLFVGGWVVQIEAIKLAMDAVPDAFIAAGEAAANGFLEALRSMAQHALIELNALLKSMQRAFAGTPFEFTAPQIETQGGFDENGNPRPFNRQNWQIDIGGAAAKERLGGLLDTFFENIEGAFSKDWVGDYVTSIRRRIQEGMGDVQLPDGSNGTKIPIPHMRGVDDQPGELDFYDDLKKASAQRIRELEAERNSLGLTGAAAESYRFQQDAINEALSKNIQLSPEMLAGIKAMGDAYGAAAQKLKAAELQQDLTFERGQLFRSPGEQDIASRLRGTGMGMDSPEAEYMRQTQRLAELKDGINGFFSDFRHGLMQGESFGESLGNAILNALSRQLDKYLDDVFGQLAGAFAKAIFGDTAASSGGGAGGLVGQVADQVTRIFSPANQNDAWAGLRAANGNPSIYRDAIASIESAGSGGYSAIGPTNATLGRALGRYQIMEANIGPWSQAALGRTLTPAQFMANPSSQDAIFDHVFGGYVSKYGERGAAQAWFGGPGSVGKLGRSDVLGTTVGGYGDKFMSAMDKLGGASTQATAAVEGMATGAIGATQGLGGFAGGLSQLANSLMSVGGGAGGSGWFSGLMSMFGGTGGAVNHMMSISPAATAFLARGGAGLFAEGGVADRPSIFGEAGPEAAVPLSRGRYIPVEMRMPRNTVQTAASPARERPKIEIHVHGARGNAEIREMVMQGVNESLSEYNDVALPARVHEIVADPRGR